MNSILTIPCHWDKKIILDIVDNNFGDKDIIVGEVYGALARGPLRHGRASGVVPNISRSDSIKFRNFIRGLGLKFNYLVNAPLPTKHISGLNRESIDYLKWILFKFKPDSVTVSSSRIMAEIRCLDKNVNINVSTIAGVKSPRGLQRYDRFKVSRVVPHHDVGKNPDELKTLMAYCKKLNINMELLATESCLYGCPKRDDHYLYLAEGDHDKPFHSDCNFIKVSEPAEFLMAGGVIRPEDLHFYESLGVRYFKITGRSKPAYWLPEVAQAYLRREYDGNLVRLLGADPSLSMENWIYIDNKALNSFISSFPFNQSDLTKKRYCNRVISELYSAKKFYLKDGSKYQYDRGILKLMTLGKVVRGKLIKR